MSVDTRKQQLEKSLNQNGENIRKKTEEARSALRWWVGTVVLTLFPTLTTLLVAAMRKDTKSTVDLIFNDGELILSSFIIVTSTLVSCYDVKEKSVITDLILYLLLGSDFLQLIIYTVFKTNPENNLFVVVIVSVISLAVSIVTSWTWYLLTRNRR